MTGVKIYNLFPRLVGSMTQWITHFDRIKDMGFDWIYINPFHYPGFSGSLYAVKDYYAFNPLFVDADSTLSTEDQLRAVCEQAHQRGLKLMMDLVINHTGIDSILAHEHPEWYKYNEDGSIQNPGCDDNGSWITWGDLASIDNEHSSDRDSLWSFWLKLIRDYVDIGFDGFRCDAAYHVPNELWEYIFKYTKTECRHVRFFGETLGCTAEQVVITAQAGFDYIFNFSKWWDFKEDWFIREFGKFVGVAPSISFPETHDTPRLSCEYDGNVAASRLRYAGAAYLTAGVMMPLGYEYGFKKRVNVVHTMPEDWEEPSFDLSAFIKDVNTVKESYQIFNEDTHLRGIWVGSDTVRGYIRDSKDGSERVLIMINTDIHEHQTSYVHDFYHMMGTDEVKDISLGYKMEQVPNSFKYDLHPGDIKLFYTKLR